MCQAKDRDIDFDIDIAIGVCRKSSSEDALMLAEKYGLHLWYIKILLEDHRKYLAALQYMAKLEFTQVRFQRETPESFQVYSIFVFVGVRFGHEIRRYFHSTRAERIHFILGETLH